MTIQQLRYIVATAESGSITEAASALFISQPSLSNAIREIEKETGITLFNRGRFGIALTPEGVEFVGYARQVIQQMELLEDKYVSHMPEKIRFGVSTQHYTFTTNAFLDMVEQFGEAHYDFILNETRTHQIMEDVKNRFSDLGVLYYSHHNESVIRRALEERHLVFNELFTARPHVFLRKNHPLAKQAAVTLEDLRPYPRLNFFQGSYESAYYAEELFSTEPTDRSIRISDRGAIVNLMIGMDAYTISSGIFPRHLQGGEILAVPLAAEEEMHIGYILNEKQPLSPLGEIYVQAMRRYGPDSLEKNAGEETE